MKSKSIFDSEDFLIDIVDGISIVRIKLARITSDKTEEFKQLLDTLLATKHFKIIFDFSDCQYVDSMIIGIMVQTLKTARKKGGDILVITPGGSINVLFARTGLYKIFKQFWTIEKAIESITAE